MWGRARFDGVRQQNERRGSWPLLTAPPPPGPRQAPIRRSRNASKEVKEEEVKKEAYPVPQDEEFDQYAYDMANLNAAKGMATKATKSAHTAHKTPAPYGGLNSIVG